MQRIPRFIPILLKGSLFLFLLVGAFVCGVWIGPSLYIHRSPVEISESIISMNPPIDGPIFPSQVYEDLNLRIEEFLDGEKVRKKYSGISPHYIVVPSPHGYTKYYWLEEKDKKFPPELSEECSAFAHQVLWGLPVGSAKDSNQAAGGDRDIAPNLKTH